MLVLPQTVEMTCRPNNKEYLLSKGYVWEYNKKVNVDVLDLREKAEFKVKVICDYCLEKGIENEIYPTYKLHVKNKNNNLKDSCSACQGLKNKDVMRSKYGVSNANDLSHVKKGHMKRMEKRKPKIEDIANEFSKRNYSLISKKYINKNEDLEYLCLKHEDMGIQTISYGNFQRNHGCYYCGRERMIASQTGENSHFWRGGITPLSNYMREKMIKWKRDSLEFHHFKCVVTGRPSDNLIVHHTYSFSKMLKETLEELKYPTYYEINNYTEDELTKIEKLLFKKHYEYGLGAPLLHEVHEEFHRIYGKGNNTPEQFEEFKNNYTINNSIMEVSV